MLNGGVLDHSTISVTSNDTEAPKLANIKPISPSTTTAEEKHGDEIDQEGARANLIQSEIQCWLCGLIDRTDKPRTAIVAELLGSGYHLSDQVVHKAIETDSRTFSQF